MVEIRKKRGILLTIWLIFLLIGLIFTAITYTDPASIFYLQLSYSGKPAWIFSLLAILTFIDLIFIIATFRWKRWGVYGFSALYIVSSVINLYMVGLGPTLFSLIGLIIFLLLIRPKWALFE